MMGKGRGGQGAARCTDVSLMQCRDPRGGCRPGGRGLEGEDNVRCVLYTDLSGRGESGRWGAERGQRWGQSPHRGLRTTLWAGTGVLET